MKKNYYRLNLAIVSAFTDIERQFSSGRILNGNKLPVADRLIGQFGGANRDRTDDLNTASVALSQLSYGPMWIF